MENTNPTGNLEKILTDTAAKEDLAPELWGLASSIDLKDCNPELIRSEEAIKDFTGRLIKLIKMKAFGECHVVHFGTEERVAGYSMFQLIETSCISAHFANFSNAVYLDVFSCRMYDPQVVAEFAKEYFEAKSYNLHVTKRY